MVLAMKRGYGCRHLMKFWQYGTAAHDSAVVVYYRPEGKVSRQTYDLKPVADNLFYQAAEFSQQRVHPKPRLEIRVPYKGETGHGEFDDWESFLSRSEGLFRDRTLKNSLGGWIEPIAKRLIIKNS